MIARRALIGSLLAAPAIVRPGLLMPVSVARPERNRAVLAERALGGGVTFSMDVGDQITFSGDGVIYRVRGVAPGRDRYDVAEAELDRIVAGWGLRRIGPTWLRGQVEMSALAQGRRILLECTAV